MTLSEQQRQSALEGKPVEIADGNEVFYLLSKQQFDELQQMRSQFNELEEIEFSPYEVDDIVESDNGE